MGRTARCQRAVRRRGARHEPLDFGRSHSPFTGLYNIVLRRFIGFVSGGSPGLAGSVAGGGGGGEGEGGQGRDVEARRERDYEGGDAVTSSYSRVKRKSWKREFGLEGRTYVTTPSPPSPNGRDMHSSRFPECPLERIRPGRSVKRDKTNLGRSARRVSSYPAPYLLLLVPRAFL